MLRLCSLHGVNALSNLLIYRRLGWHTPRHYMVFSFVGSATYSELPAAGLQCKLMEIWEASKAPGTKCYLYSRCDFQCFKYWALFLSRAQHSNTWEAVLRRHTRYKFQTWSMVRPFRFQMSPFLPFFPLGGWFEQRPLAKSIQINHKNKLLNTQYIMCVWHTLWYFLKS